jgi:hypothetical protein
MDQEISMGVQLAWEGSQKSVQNKDSRQRRAELMFARLARPSLDKCKLQLGQRVTYNAEPGQIVAINISSLGRWPGHLYPYVVVLDCGLTIRCNNLDLAAEKP